MTTWPMDLAKSRILVTNDDGIDAPGLAVLIEIAESLSSDVWVVAPTVDHTGAGHSLTLRRPLRVHERGPKRFAVDGTPTDCVLMALNEIMAENMPNLVLSGVNRGANLGEDVTYSGTIAAALEATILSVPAIAMSQYFVEREEIRWDTARRHGPDMVRRLTQLGWPADNLISVNYPSTGADKIKGVRLAEQGVGKSGDQIVRGTDPRGEAYYWIGELVNIDAWPEGSDLEAVTDGYISITPIKTNFTDPATLKSLQQAFD